MTFEFLQEFALLANIRNYTAAAEEMFTTEATLSRHIKKLEAEIGGSLFLRTTRSVELTTLGKSLLPYAEKSTQLKRQIDSTLAEQIESDTNRLNISAVNIANTYIDIPKLLSKMHSDYPNITIDISEPPSDLPSAFNKERADLCMVLELDGYEDKSYERFQIYDDELVAVIPETHPLYSREPLSITDLKDEKIILLKKGTFMHTVCIQACQSRGFEPNIILTLTSGDDMLNMVNSGLGIAVSAAHPFHTDLPGGMKKNRAAIRAFDPAVRINFSLVYPQNPSRAARAFIKCVKHNPSFYADSNPPRIEFLES